MEREEGGGTGVEYRVNGVEIVDVGKETERGDFAVEMVNGVRIGWFILHMF